jgi:ABC-type hemin transport system ATPase subunit
MLDEVEPADRLVVLHRGAVRWMGEARDFAPKETLEAAFLHLTRNAA